MFAALVERVPLIQALYYLLTGLWPVVHIGSFQALTGPKGEHWLVRSTGLLLGVIGLTLAFSSRCRPPSSETPVLGVGTAAVLAGVDVVYVLRRRIWPVYLGGALLERGFIGCWAAARRGLARAATA